MNGPIRTSILGPSRTGAVCRPRYVEVPNRDPLPLTLRREVRRTIPSGTSSAVGVKDLLKAPLKGF
jgi:hypothetical protein